MKDIIVQDRLQLVAPRKKLTDKVLARLAQYEAGKQEERLDDEQVWTLLFTYGFVAPGGDPQEGIVVLAETLIEGPLVNRGGLHAWLEMLPLPPRQGKEGQSESNSEIDLVVGNQSVRNDTTSGIQFEPNGQSNWICMVEAKWASDIAYRTTHDLCRNQLARVIETALTFQNRARTPWLPDHVHVTLLTPRRFKYESVGSRLYFYKFVLVIY